MKTWPEIVADFRAQCQSEPESETTEIPAAIPPDVARVVRLLEERYDDPLIIDLVEQVALRR